jgi:hypothetical protein
MGMDMGISRCRASAPCRDTSGNPTLRIWRASAAAGVGWFSCSCGAVGVCEGCLAKTGGQRPVQAIAVWCTTHHETICGKRMPLRGAASLAV